MAQGDIPEWISAYGAAVSAATSLAALIAAVFAARAAWAVLRVERARDEERRLAEDRVQAQLVAAWPSTVRTDPADPSSPPRWGAAVRNAGEVPIYQVHVEFEPIRPTGGTTAVIVEVVPPGEWLVSGRELYVRPEQLSLTQGVMDMPPRQFVVALRFTDAAGRTWHRDRRGVLVRVQAGSH